MTPSLILDTTARLIFRTAALFSVFLLFAGHNAPGGGFVGGLVAAAALVLRFVTGGADEVRKVVALRPDILLAVGIIIAASTGIAAWFVGGAFLESGQLAATLPIVGKVKASSALAFDVGVYLVVLGLGLLLLRTLGGEEDA